MKRDERRDENEPITEDADALIAQGQAIATVLAEKREQLGISIDPEALLRASLERTTCAINGYVALVAAANKVRYPDDLSVAGQGAMQSQDPAIAPAGYASHRRAVAANGSGS